MAEIFIPKVLDQLSDITLRKIQERVNLVVGAEDEVKKLSKTLKTLETVLYDAERRRLEDDGVRRWLEMLDDVAYEMEDVLEEWNVKIVKTKEPQPIQKHTLLEKVRMFIKSFCSCLKQVPLRSEFGLKIKEINDKLDSILTEAQKFSFITSTPSRNPFSEFKQPITMSNVDETKVHGRENDKKTLLKHLLFQSQTSTDKEVIQDNRFKVISIVGLGGSGKTTLAQFLYNDERVRNHFNLQKWVCVSDPFDEIRIAKSLVERSGNNVSNLEIGSLLECVKELFSNKRFLLVLDDVWTENSSKWEQILLSFKDCAPGSVILVTTRSEWVARAIGTHYQHKLDFLEDSDCWLIIKQIALSRRSELCKIVEVTGRRIANKCKGLPLAAKTLGGVLLFKDTLREWREILDSNIWQMEKAAMDLFPHFYLSYKELSPAMKRCFSFCAIYPKDYVIYTDNLIRMWMAQGYLGGGGNRMELEDVVKNLAVRSFFQEIKESRGVIYCVKMHDLVHDFARFLVKGECHAFVEGEANCENAEREGRPRRRHVMASGKVKSILDFLVFDIGNLRTLCLNHTRFPDDISNESVINMLNRLKYVRALTLGRLGLNVFPQEIGSLIHLRFLDVSGNYFTELPETICDLHYLQTLDVSQCEYLSHLPERFGDLGQLRYLLNEDTGGLKQTQHGIENLTSLRVVRKMVLRDDGASLDVIAKLIHLEELYVYFSEWNDLESMEVALLELIEHASHIRELAIVECKKLPFPKGMVSKLASSSITHLYIHNCDMISPLPVLGKLPYLQCLSLSSLSGIEHIGREFYGLSEANVHSEEQCVVFPALKTLGMAFLRDWKTWEDISEEYNNISVMPLLEILFIVGCSRLEAIPRQILKKASPLKELLIHYCDRLKIEYSWMTTIRSVDIYPKPTQRILSGDRASEGSSEGSDDANSQNVSEGSSEWLPKFFRRLPKFFSEVGCIRTRNKVVCCHFSSDGKLLASAGHDKKAVLWNMDTLQTETTGEEHEYLITDVRFRPNSTQLATSSFDKSVRLWDAANPGFCLNAYTSHSSHILSLDFHPKKNDLFCFCDSSNEIRYWNISPFSCARVSKQGGSAHVRFQPNTGHLLAAASDKVVTIYDVENDRQIHSFQGHGVVNYLCWDLSGDYLASVSEDSVKVWSLASGQCIHDLSSYKNQFHSCVFHPDYSALLVIGGVQSLELWNMVENKSMTVPAHESIIAALAQSPVTGMVASASHDSSVKLWK